MRGLMQDRPLLISSLIMHMLQSIISKQASAVIDNAGTLQRWTYPELHERSAQLAHALGRLGVNPGDRIATLAWNDQSSLRDHSSPSRVSGAIYHGINPRLFSEQISEIVRDAEDRWLYSSMPGLLTRRGVRHLVPYRRRLKRGLGDIVAMH